MRGIKISNDEHLKQEKYHLNKVLMSIGYRKKNIRSARRRAIKRVGGEPRSQTTITMEI